MVKSELIDRLAEQQPHLDFKDVEFAVTTILEQMTEELSNGGRVEIRGFGVFTSRKKPAHIGRNPQTGEQVSVPERYGLHFKAGKPLLESLNQ